jgi:uncharacterized protein
MSWAALPATAAWTHRGSQTGFEVAWFDAGGGGTVLTGCTAATDESGAWAVDYEIRVDGAWRTQAARVRGRSAGGIRIVELTTDGQGRWAVDGAPAPHLDGCLDIDLESSAVTNTLPVHRLALRPGERGASPAAWVRAADLAVERLAQDYRYVGNRSFDYAATSEDFTARLVYDDAGLVLEYPGIAARSA